MKTIARLVVRGSDKNDGLIIGVCMKGSVLPKGVYEIREILGEHVLDYVGPSALDGKGHPSWNNSIDQILQSKSPKTFLTKDEYAEQDVKQ